MPTRYEQILQLSKEDNSRFDKYEKACRAFAGDLRADLIQYLECPENKLGWNKFRWDESEESLQTKDIIAKTDDQLMVLYSNAFYGFGFQFWLDDGTYLHTPLFVKLVDDKFYLRIGKKTVTLETENSKPPRKFTEIIVKELKDYLENRFSHFVLGKPKIGFTTREKNQP